MSESVEAVIKKSRQTISFEKRFSSGFKHPFESVKWAVKDAVITGADGKEKFRQNGVEVPEWWNDTTINIVAEKYFRVVDGKKETSAKQMFSRVASWLKKYGVEQGLLTPAMAVTFEEELLYMFVNGMHAFNSPVWFNMGVIDPPQCSACFIQSVEDTMESITSLAQREVMLFKGGSGTGSNLSNLRSSHETLSGGGSPSGPVSFMTLFDTGAGVTKSGGTTRRAAKMVVLNADHPDILEQKDGRPGFITCKSHAEKLAHDLYSTGKYTAEWNKPGNVYDFAGFQNANNSVRVTDEFMNAAEKNEKWYTRKITDKTKTVHEYNAAELMDKIAEAAWVCGDPGIQFDTATNDMHTCKESGRINASNPCQPAWALVLTPDGIRTFNEINIGSTIWSGKRWTKVIRKVATGIKSVYRFYTRAGVFEGTEEHRVLSNDQRVMVKNAETIDTALGTLDYPGARSPQDVVDGLVFGDGQVRVCNDGADHYALLYVGEDDQSYFSDREVAEYINSTPFDRTAHRVRTTLVRKELPLTFERVIPDRFFRGTVDKACGFLRGLYSANGSVVDGRVTLKAASFSVVHQVQMMLSSMGIRSYYTVNRPTNVEFNNGSYTCKQSYDLNITTSRGDFKRSVGFIQPYKQERLEEACLIDKAARSPKSNYDVVDRQYVADEPVWDIEVDDEEHTYWTGGLLVSNCSEYLFLDDTACNLSSLNLLRFADGKKFDLDGFIHACDIAIVAKEIIVGASSYPSPIIKEMSHKFRTLGLGFTNLGALLTYWGLPYDSNEGRTIAGAITAVMTGAAYRMSAGMAQCLGAFPEYEKNKESMLGVIRKHWDAAKRLPSTMTKEWRPIIEKAYDVWKDAYEVGKMWGYRNAQVTVEAPTGTISFLMAADTTGIEPMLGCVVYKKVVGEGVLMLPNGVIPAALKNLGYVEGEVANILAHIRKTGVIHDAPQFDIKHGPIFAEALGKYAIRPEAHVDMMAAVQPFLSGGISKTVNMPKNCTPKDIQDIYFRAWKGGLKCIAVYRDGCKLSQPISTEFSEKSKAIKKLSWGDRKRMPTTRKAIVHKFSVGQQEGYLTAGLYPDGSLGEFFIEVAKQGSTLMGIVDAWATAVSIGLQHGVPFETYKNKFCDMNFAPSGFTDDEQIRIAKSICDYIFRWLDLYIVNKKTELEKEEVLPTTNSGYDGPPCSKCGNLTKRAGSCWCCTACGTTTGCS